MDLIIYMCLIWVQSLTIKAVSLNIRPGRVKLNDSASLECNVGGLFREAHFYREGVKFATLKRHFFSCDITNFANIHPYSKGDFGCDISGRRRTLNLKKIRKIDINTKWTCEAIGRQSNEVTIRGTENTPGCDSLQISISAPQQLNINDTTEVKEVTLSEGNGLEVICESNMQESSYNWKLYTDNMITVASRNITINNLTKNDTGRYKCVVEKDGCMKEKSVIVNVSYSPSIIIHLTQLNNSLHISCAVDALPDNITVFPWKHEYNGRFVRHLQGYQVGLKTMLDIYNVTLLDSGSYSCTATNGIADFHGQFNISNSIDVFTTGPPVSMNIAKEQFVIVGENSMIKTSFLIEEIVNATLYYDNGQVDITNDTFIEEMLVNVYGSEVWRNVTTVRITLPNVTESNISTYVIEFCNNYGCDSSTVTVNTTRETLTQDKETGDDRRDFTDVIIGSVIGVVVFMILVVIIIIVRRRSRNSAFKTSLRQKSSRRTPEIGMSDLKYHENKNSVISSRGSETIHNEICLNSNEELFSEKVNDFVYCNTVEHIPNELYISSDVPDIKQERYVNSLEIIPNELYVSSDDQV